MGTLPNPFDPGASGPEYLYVLFADYLTARVEDGTLPPGAMLPRERRLAAEHGVSLGTARRATRLLRERGLVVTLPSRGTFVVNDTGRQEQPRARAADRGDPMTD